MDYDRQQLAAVEQEIKLIISSEEYKALVKYDNVWIARNVKTDEEMDKLAEWTELKSRLDRLKTKEQFWQQAILSSNSAAVKKTDTMRKGYKRETAVKSERALLTTVAEDLYKLYDFSIQYEDEEQPSFGDVKRALGFHKFRDVRQYFATGKNPNSNYIKRKETSKAMEDMYSEDDWKYLIQLNHHVNGGLHSGLLSNDGRITIVLENDFYSTDRVRSIIGKTRSEILDIKNAESDSDKSSQ